MNYQKYEDIWLALNNLDLEKINLSNNFMDEDLKFTKIEQYFEKNTPLKFINLKKLNEEQITYLLEKKILLSYLIKNFKKSINGDGNNISRNPRQFQIEAIKDKCIYAICPFSGIIIKSNKSVFITEECVFYRFISQEVFYLITTNLSSGFKKGAFYFPKHQLIIRADEQPWGLRRQHIARFKALLVSNFQEIYSYFLNINPPEKIAIIIGNNNFAHHIWNELSGLYRLYKSDLIKRVDKLFILRETLGEINQIFPEITPDKIERIEPLKNNMNASEIQLKIFQDK